MGSCHRSHLRFLHVLCFYFVRPSLVFINCCLHVHPVEMHGWSSSPVVTDPNFHIRAYMYCVTDEMDIYRRFLFSAKTTNLIKNCFCRFVYSSTVTCRIWFAWRFSVCILTLLPVTFRAVPALVRNWNMFIFISRCIHLLYTHLLLISNSTSDINASYIGILTLLNNAQTITNLRSCL